MLLLMLFALIAGAGTAITPCVLPVLPALLSASALGGRRRPLGIVLGLAVTFTVAIVALAQLVKGVDVAKWEEKGGGGWWIVSSRTKRTSLNAKFSPCPSFCFVHI